MSTKNSQVCFQYNGTSFHLYKECLDETYRLEISSKYNDECCVLITERVAFDLIAALQLIQKNELKLLGRVDEDKLSYLDPPSRKSREKKILNKNINDTKELLNELEHELEELNK